MPEPKTPRELGYRFPPEWAPHAGTWLSWPRPEGISFPGRYDHIAPNLAAIVTEIGQREVVNVNVPDARWEERIREQLARERVPAGVLERVRFWHIPTNESWCRDHGPAFVLRDAGGRMEAAVVDWGFNAWGGKYPPWDADDAVPTRVAENLGLPVFNPGIVMSNTSRSGSHKGASSSIAFPLGNVLSTSNSCSSKPAINASNSA